MKKNKFILISLMVIFGIILTPSFAKGASDLTFTFDSDTLYTESDPDFYIDKLSNVKPSGYYTNDYNATYSFENDIGGYPSNWIIGDGGGSVSVISEWNGHNSVIEILDYLDSGYNQVKNDFDSYIQTGNIEFWIFHNDTSYAMETTVREITTRSITLYIITDKIQYYYSAGFHDATNGVVYDNTWYHFRIDFDCNSDTYDFYLNNVLLDSDIPFRTVSTNGVNNFYFRTDTPSKDYVYYIDAVGFDWNNVFVSNDFTYTFQEFTNGQEFDVLEPEYTNWIYFKDPNTIATIENTNPFDGQYVRLTDNSGTGLTLIDGYIPNSISNATNFYFKTNDSTQDTQIHFREGPSSCFHILISGFLYYDSNIIGIILNNTWYQITADFNCTTDKVSIYLNQALVVDNQDFDIYNPDYIDNVRFRTGIPSKLTSSFDNITLTGSIRAEYSVGVNFFPYMKFSDYIEVDRFEFAYSDFEVLYPIGNDDFSGWLQIETGGDLVNTKANSRWTADRVIGITHYAPTSGQSGIIRWFNEHGNIINVNYSVEIINDGNPVDEFFMKVYAFDNTSVSNIFIENGQLRYEVGGGDVFLRAGLIENEPYTLNLYINYNDNITILDFYIDGVYTDTYSIPLLASGKEGLGGVGAWIDGRVLNDFFMDIDYIGVSVNYSTLSTEFGHVRIDDIIPFESYWNFENFNLVHFDIIGNSGIWISESHPYLLGISQISQIAKNYDYITSDTVNVYGLDDFGAYGLQDPIIWFVIYEQFIFNEITIEGVILKEGVNEYNLELEYSNVDINESYFYESSNRLYFNHYSDDTNLEYIQALFNINDVSSNNYSISYRSFIDNNAYGYMRVNYTGTSNIIQMRNVLTTTRFLLEQERIVRNLVILITDKDNNVISGLTTGFVYNIKFLDVISIQTTIITQSILTMMIPLIIILIPTLMFAKKFGKDVIIPFMILFSLILTMTGSIPAWLFFIILFPSLIIIFFKSKVSSV